MQRLLSLLAVTTFALLGLSLSTVSLSAQSLQLADGRVLLASVVDADGDGLRVRRLDNGGLLDLRWGHLSTSSATTWKRKLNLIGEAQNELMVLADEVHYETNGRNQSIIGRIIDATGDPLIVQVKGVPYRIARSDLKRAQKVEVPAIQVFTKDEFYQDALDRHAPGDNADKQMLLAEDLIKFRDYDRAAYHLNKAKELDNATDKRRVDTLIDRLNRFKAAAKELGMLEQIQISRSRGGIKNFKKGREWIAKFEQEFPKTKLKAEFDRAKTRFEEARTRFFTGKVADQWRRSIRSMATKQVGSEGFTLQAAKDYAQNEMSKAIVVSLSKSLELTPEETEQMWSNRKSHPTGRRTEHFNYGIGSWVLGEKEILKDTSAGKATAKTKANKKEPSGKDRDIERFAKLLRQAMERRRSAQSQGEQKQLTPEAWWEDASKGERVSWLRSYYAEFGGQMVVDYASAQQCISCYGEGSTPEVDGQGKPVRKKCFLCQGTKWTRSFKAY